LSAPISTPSTPSGGRLAMIIVGGLILFAALAIMFLAIALHWVNGKRDDDGYFTTGDAHVITPTYAVTNDLDVHRGLVSLIGKDGFSRVRIQVHSDRDARVFVGVARSHDAFLYLQDSRHDVITDFDLAPFRPQYRTTRGDEPPADPAKQSFWVASATSEGRDATLDWKVESGPWTLVVMNPDSTPGVTATVNAGAQIPLIGKAAWIVTAAGLLVAALGGLLLALGLRRRRQPSSPDGSAWAA
jgi:hypothetical protein